MELEALKQSLASLDINPDEIKDERYANAFRILFSIIETQNEKIEFLMEDNQKLRDAINLLKGEQAKLSRILTKDIDLFHQEKADIFLEGLKATPYQQIDDTGARVNGVNNYTEILCNPYYAAYFTVPNKNRENILDVILYGKEKTYCFNTEAFDLIFNLAASNTVVNGFSIYENVILRPVYASGQRFIEKCTLRNNLFLENS